jgi:hypothetical protein
VDREVARSRALAGVRNDEEGNAGREVARSRALDGLRSDHRQGSPPRVPVKSDEGSQRIERRSGHRPFQ